MTADIRSELDRMAREIADLKARLKMLEPGRHQPHVSPGSGDMRLAVPVVRADMAVSMSVTDGELTWASRLDC